ncbi:hypothetical protein Val02_12860 [Virgisporangium aliadipatigenens]|uniref:Uncharacterized protein n=2 Tax=Virgisporangium aliadipatigenens TaxID=741659 RepID=A0A8J3YI54_9ACTN|nr:hypothetical protein Val02_12860 [Virgisporangium aliadipatigenens]
MAPTRICGQTRVSENEVDVMKKFAKPVAILLLVFMIAFRPGESADAVKNIVGVFGDMADGAGTFLTSLLQ